MSRRWNKEEIEKMLELRQQGKTEKKIADMMSLIFMRHFSDRAVNRKIRDMKKAGLIPRNAPGTTWVSPLTGEKRDGRNHVRVSTVKPSKRNFNAKQAKSKKRNVIGSERWLEEMASCDTD